MYILTLLKQATVRHMLTVKFTTISTITTNIKSNN